MTAKCDEQDSWVFGTIILHIHLGDTRVSVMFRIFKKLALLVLFETTFIDRFVEGIFPTERKIFPYNLQPLSILKIHEVSVENRIETRKINVFDGAVQAVRTEEQEHVA